MKDLVMFHANCTDGTFAAYAHWSSKATPDDSIYYPVSYGPKWADVLKKLKSDVPDLIDRRVFILDFSYPPQAVLELGRLTKAVILLDHHKSAMEQYRSYAALENTDTVLKIALSSNILVYFDLDHSGAVITYQYLFGADVELPKWYEWVQDRDLWRFDLEDTSDFAAGIRFYMGSTPFDHPDHFAALDSVLTDIPDIMIKGRVVESVRNVRISKHLAQSINTVVITSSCPEPDTRYRVGFKNADYDLASDLAQQLLAHHDLDMVVIYSITSRNTVGCSVRSIKTVDSSFFSLHHGGGGHPQANGCEISMGELLTYLQEDIVHI